MKYAARFLDWLVDENYTHCFFVAGGNVMHLLDAARTRFHCVPFVHEVSAGIAAEYFNEVASEGREKAFALVTAGPGLTNIVTAMAGAFLESRELLIVGGQVKSTDLSGEGLRQRGIQEVDGIRIAASLCVATLAITYPLPRSDVIATIRRARRPRKGPVFIEFCLDAQGAATQDQSDLEQLPSPDLQPSAFPYSQAHQIAQLVSNAERPLLLLGGGLSRAAASQLLPRLTQLGIPIATTWNGADRIGSEHPLYFGRPNTWGMRWANVLIQQADVLLAIGTRLGMQQTGFNWKAFAPEATVVHVDIDPAELTKGHPFTHLSVSADAADFLKALTEDLLNRPVVESTRERWKEWVTFGHNARHLLPLADPANRHDARFLDPYEFMIELSAHLRSDDLIVPCSSGGAFTVAMQAFGNKAGQRIVSNKGLASMGYGLAGAIGAALAQPGHRTILFEGDGGFAQNLQEVGTVAANQLPVKMFIFCNDGYASIRMTQRSYFGGVYVGCDSATGLGLPDWPTFFSAYGIDSVALASTSTFTRSVLNALNSPDPKVFLVPIDPEQTYYPKITSRIANSGAMESNPLHKMTPDLEAGLTTLVLPYINRS